MSYRLKLSEPLDAGRRRIVVGQIGRKQAASKRRVAAPTWVHDTRKSLKRVRALLRLLRSGLSKKEWRRANDDLRQIGRSLSALRERDVLPHTIAALRTTAQPSVAAALDRLVSVLDQAPKATPDRRGVDHVDETSKSLSAAAARLGKLRLSGTSGQILSDGLAATHHSGQRMLAATRRDPTDEAVHDLRKVIQVHWRQMQLLERAWPDVLRVRAATAKDVAQALGQHQDLAMLIQAVQEAAPDGPTEADVVSIVETCRRAQLALRVRALPLAARLFAADPHAFAAEVMACWHLAEVACEGMSKRKKKASAGDP